MYSAGAVTNQIVSSGVSYFNAGNIGIGTTIPWPYIDCRREIRATGILYDSTNAAGSGGYLLMSAATGCNGQRHLHCLAERKFTGKRDEWICN